MKKALRETQTLRALVAVRFGHRPPARCKHQSHRQDRLQYTAPLASAQCRYRKEVKNKNTRKVIKKEEEDFA